MGPATQRSPPVASERPARRRRAEAWLALAALAGVWGYSWVAMKVATRDGSPLLVAALRAVVGAAALLLYLPLSGRPLRPTPFLSTFVYGLLQTAGFTLLATLAVSTGGVGKTAILAYTMPFWLALLAWRFLGEKIRGATWLAFGLAAVGLWLVVTPLGTSTRANALAVGAGLVWAASAVWVVRALAKERQDLLSLTAWQMVWGALALLAVAALVPVHVRWTPSFVWAIAFLGIGASALAWTLWLFVLSRLPAGVAGLGSLAVPVVGVVLAAAQLGEIPSRSELTGIALIVTGLAVQGLAKGAGRR
jgi:drug/metabolite transporter (DMT)-like permease